MIHIPTVTVGVCAAHCMIFPPQQRELEIMILLSQIWICRGPKFCHRMKEGWHTSWASRQKRCVQSSVLCCSLRLQIGGSKKARAGSTGLAVPVTLVFRPGIT